MSTVIEATIEPTVSTQDNTPDVATQTAAEQNAEKEEGPVKGPDPDRPKQRKPRQPRKPQQPKADKPTDDKPLTPEAIRNALLVSLCNHITSDEKNSCISRVLAGEIYQQLLERYASDGLARDMATRHVENYCMATLGTIPNLSHYLGVFWLLKIASTKLDDVKAGKCRAFPWSALKDIASAVSREEKTGEGNQSNVWKWSRTSEGKEKELTALVDSFIDGANEVDRDVKRLLEKYRELTNRQPRKPEVSANANAVQGSTTGQTGNPSPTVTLGTPNGSNDPKVQSAAPAQTSATNPPHNPEQPKADKPSAKEDATSQEETETAAEEEEEEEGTGPRIKTPQEEAKRLFGTICDQGNPADVLILLGEHLASFKDTTFAMSLFCGLMKGGQTDFLEHLQLSLGKELFNRKAKAASNSSKRITA